MKIKFLFGALLGLFLIGCEVKETNNYLQVQDPILAGRLGTEVGFWSPGKKLVMNNSQNNYGINLPTYTTGGDNNISFITNNGDAVFVFDRGDLNNVALYTAPYFLIAIGKVTKGTFHNGKFIGGKFVGKAYNMSKQADNSTITVDGLNLTFKDQMDLEMTFNLAEEEKTFEKKLGVSMKFEDNTLGSFGAGEFKREEIGAANLKNGDTYNCWGKNSGPELTAFWNTGMSPFKFEQDETTKELSFNRTGGANGAYSDCTIGMKLDRLNINDNGFFKVSNGSVSACKTSGTPKHKDFLHGTDYKGIALAFNDKRFRVWMASDTTKKALALDCKK